MSKCPKARSAIGCSRRALFAPSRESEGETPTYRSWRLQRRSSFTVCDVPVSGFAAVEEGVTALRKQLGPGWLQRDRLAHDGADILRNLADRDNPEWIRARDAQAGIPGYIEVGLEHIEFDIDGIPGRVRLAKCAGAEVIIDPRFGFGQPILDEQGVRVQDVAGLFLADDSIAVVSEEFGVAEPVVESIVRSYARRRAA